MNQILDKRSEILFLYDASDCNPNGDPLNENRPRIDEEVEVNIVTDVRLKRTVRDYLSDYLGQAVFIKEEKTDDGMQKTRTRRLAEFITSNSESFPSWQVAAEDLKEMKDSKMEENIGNLKTIELEQALFDHYVDLRLFGATIAVKKGTIKKTGPVQFKLGRSLHKVEPMFIKGTTVMPSKEEKTVGTMTEVYVLPYSLICFYGIANENAAKSTSMKTADLDLLMDGLWNGTKSLITRSKFGQVPRLLLRVEYSEKNYHIGELDKYIKIVSEKEDKALRSIDDLIIDIDELIDRLNVDYAKISAIYYKADERAVFMCGGEKIPGDRLGEALPQSVEVSEIAFL